MFKIRHLNFHFKYLESQERIKPKVNKKRDIGAENNEREINIK